MAALNFRDLSYKDLVEKLIEYGIPRDSLLVGYSRFTLIIKLKHLMQSKKCNSERFRRLSRYSSGDEDSDAERKKIVMPSSSGLHVSGCIQPATDLRHSRLMAPTSPQPHKYRRGGTSMDHVQLVHSGVYGLVQKSVPVQSFGESKVILDTVSTPRWSSTVNYSSRRTRSGYGHSEGVYRTDDDFETGSDSDAQGSVRCRRTLSEFTGSDKTQKTHTVSHNERVDKEVDVMADHTPARAVSNTCPEFGITDSYPRPSQIDSGRNKRVAVPNTRRGLSSITTDSVMEREYQAANGVLTQNRSINVQRELVMAQEFKSIEEKVWISLHYQKISMILVAVLVLFFLGLGLMYVNVCFKERNWFGSDEKGNKYPTCNLVNAQEPLCIQQKHLKQALMTLSVLSPKLMAAAVDTYCGDSALDGPIWSSLSHNEAVEFLVKSTNKMLSEANQNVRNLKILLLSNPHWTVKISDFGIEESAYSTDHMKEYLVDKGGLTIRNPVIPIGCQLRQLVVYGLTNWVSLLMTMSIIVTGLLLGVWCYRTCRAMHRLKVYLIVDQIIAMLRNHHERMQLPGAVGSKYLSVDLCRDEIILPYNRTNLMAAWQDAVKFIVLNESRITSDIQEVRGKLVGVWQWLPTTVVGRSSIYSNRFTNQGLRISQNNNVTELLEPSSNFRFGVHAISSCNQKSRRNKVWQGQAFDTMAGSPNSLPCSPTPCLKIRHMFDPDLELGEDWPVFIQDAVLEKCADINVLHIFVDCASQEGCVFMKCSSHEEAGKAYRALHGWWFDTKLVTVKYLRTGRYHERFPEAAQTTTRLRPSNKKESSLQELWHFI